MKKRIMGPVALCLAAVLHSRAAGEVEAIEGRWLLDFDREDASRAQLSMQRRTSRHGSWNNSSSYSLAAFRGLVRPAGSADVAARFELARDAGRVVFEGSLNESGGSGRFQFTPSAEFAGFLKSAGYSAPTPDQLYSMTLHDVGRKLIEDLKSLGYNRVPIDDLISMAIHGATPQFIRDLQSLGYDRLPVEELVSMRIHGATPEFVRELKALGYQRLPAEELVTMRIHGATPEFIRELKAAGYERLSAEDLVNMRIHGASPQFVQSLKSLGYERVPAEELVNMRIHGVSPEFIRDLQALGYSHVAVEDLVNMRIHGVSAGFIRDLQTLGYRQVGVERSGQHAHSWRDRRVRQAHEGTLSRRHGARARGHANPWEIALSRQLSAIS